MVHVSQPGAIIPRLMRDAQSGDFGSTLSQHWLPTLMTSGCYCRIETTIGAAQGCSQVVRACSGPLLARRIRMNTFFHDRQSAPRPIPGVAVPKVVREMAGAMGRILVVEDEVDLNDLITRQLRQDGHEVYQAYDGITGLNLAGAIEPDLLVLDWMLPKLDGLAVARKVRERQITPILMLTARSEETDIVLGLEVGADDYLAKPFRMRELQARVRAMLRRVTLLRDEHGGESNHVGEDDRVKAGGIEISVTMRTASVGGEEIDLTPKEFDLLTLFL